MKVEMCNKEELNNLMDYDECLSCVKTKLPNIDEPENSWKSLWSKYVV